MSIINIMEDELTELRPDTIMPSFPSSFTPFSLQRVTLTEPCTLCLPVHTMG